MNWIRGGPESLDAANITDAIDNRLDFFFLFENFHMGYIVL